MCTERRRYLEEFLQELSVARFLTVRAAYESVGVDFRIVEIKSLPKKARLRCCL